MLNLYSNVLEICKKQGLTITELCKRSGVSRATLSELKMGRSKSLSTETLSKLAATLTVSTDFLLGNTESSEVTEYIEELATREEMRMLFKLAKGASKEDIEQAVKIIEAIRNV